MAKEEENHSIWQDIAGFFIVVVPVAAITWSIAARVVWYILHPIWE